MANNKTECEIVASFLQSSNRRNKCAIPDSAKDDKYWQKRKRNNIAAKRSRENKRNVEKAIRSRAECLERENLLLRKELELLKRKLDLPVNVCLLTDLDREQCLLEANETPSYTRMMALAKPTDTTCDSDFSMDADYSPMSCLSSPASVEELSPRQLVHLSTSLSPTRLTQQILQSPLHSNALHNHDNPRNILEFTRANLEASDEVPADLSVKKRSRSKDSLPPDTSSSDLDRSTKCDDSSEIRVKLELLSEQVQKMQRSFNL